MTAPTRAAIMAAEPEQLRLWCAEYAMGFRWSTVKYNHFAHGINWKKWDNILEDESGSSYIPDYPADIAAAWSVLEELSARYGCEFSVGKEKRMGHMNYYVRVSNGTIGYDGPDCTMVVMDTKPETAMCKVALLIELAAQEQGTEKEKG